MKLKCTINNKNYDIVNGATFSEEYNETLDSGNIILDGIPMDNDLRPFDDVFIYDTESEFKGYKSRKYDYFEVHTQNIGNTIIINGTELDEIYDRGFTSGSLLLKYHLNGAYNQSLMKLRKTQSGSSYIYSIAFIDSSVYYAMTKSGNNWIFAYKNLMNMDEAYFEYFTFKFVDNNITMPTFYKHLLIDSFTEERLNPTANLYKYKISLMSETKRLERIQLPNISITQPIDISLRKSVADYIHQYVELYSPTIKIMTSNDTFMYLPKYEVDESIDTIFGDVYCPNFTLDNPSLRTVLNQLFLVKDRIPYVKDDKIYAMDISARNGTFSTNKLNVVTGSRTSENHCTGLKRNYKDALSGRNTARMVEYIGFRNSDNALLTLENMRVETKFPIYKINKIYLCYYKKAQIWTYDTEPPSYTGEDKIFLCKQDITKLVLQEESRNRISKDWNRFEDNKPLTIDEMAQYKLCTVGYSIGSNKIEGWGTSYEYPKGWWGVTTITKTYIENIFDCLDGINPYGIYDVGYLSKVLEPNQYVTINGQITFRLDNVVSPISSLKGALKLKSFFFMVDYEGFYNGTLFTSKDNENRDDIITNDNPSSSLTLLEKDGLFQKEKANRFGNKAYSYFATYDDISELQELGSVDNSMEDDVVIYHREYSIYDKYVKASYYGCKDYVLKNYFTNVYAKHRPYNLLPYSQSIIRSENKKLYLMLSKDKLYFDDINSDYNVMPPIYFNEFNNYLGSLLSCVEPSLTPLTIDKFNNPNKINFGYVKYDNNKYSNDINIFTSGYSLCMNISMWDNITMGNYISDFEPTMDAGAPQDDLTGAVQSFYGVVDNTQTGFTERMGFYFAHSPDENFSDIVIDDTFGIETQLYEKLLALPLLDSFEESNVIGKEYKVFKDNKEVIDMTFQIEPYSNDENIVFSEWFMKLCDLYGVYNKFSKNTTVVDTKGFLGSIPTYCSTVFYTSAFSPNNLDYYRPVVTFKINISTFESLRAGDTFFFSYDWNISMYDALWNQHAPWEDVVVGLNIQTTSIKSVTENEIQINAFGVKKIRHGWWGNNAQPVDEPFDFVLTVIKVDGLANIDYSSDTANYYFSNVRNSTESESDPFTIISLGIDIGFKMEFKDTNDSIMAHSTSWNNNNHTLVYANYGTVTETQKTYLKNLFYRTRVENINKTLVYNEYQEGDIQFNVNEISNIITIKQEKAENPQATDYKTWIEINLSGITRNSLEIWYAEREDDSVANGTLHFVMGVNITAEDKARGYIRIYASLLAKKDERVFGRNNLVIGETVNYNDNASFNYGEKQYYVVK